MDFASMMSAQISKSKLPAKDNSAQSKYLRRADLEAERQAQYAADQARLEADRGQRLAKKRKQEDDEAEAKRLREEKRQKLAEESKARREAEEEEQERQRRRRLGLPELAPQDETAIELAEDEEDIPDADLQSKLRSLSEPATLFGEGHALRLRRYYRIMRPETAMSSKPNQSATPIPTTIILLDASSPETLVPASPPANITTDPAQKPRLKHLYAQLATYFTTLLAEWSHSLASRTVEVKTSATGQTAARTYTAVLTDLTPLFRQFEAQILPATLLTPITQIVHAAQNRQYVKANDLYLQLAIGKAAWPIGVTMVGIHERSAREKLHEHGRGRDGSGSAAENKEAHIMADEVTRKFLQSIKRCLSYAQIRWPPEDIGQMMG